VTGDVLAYVDASLSDARAHAAAAVDRAQALRELRGLLFQLAARNDTPSITPERLMDLASDEAEHAELSALIERAFPPTTTHQENTP
jgi:hypothetical protein